MILQGNEVAILQDGKQISKALVSDKRWKLIDYVDYIEVDAKGRLLTDYYVHGSLDPGSGTGPG